MKLFALLALAASTTAFAAADTELKDADGKTIIKYVVEPPDHVAPAGTKDPARQLGLFLCFPEHDTPVDADIFPVREALWRLGLRDGYAPAAKKAAPAAKATGKKAAPAKKEPVKKAAPAAKKAAPEQPRRQLRPRRPRLRRPRLPLREGCSREAHAAPEAREAGQPVRREVPRSAARAAHRRARSLHALCQPPRVRGGGARRGHGTRRRPVRRGVG